MRIYHKLNNYYRKLIYYEKTFDTRVIKITLYRKHIREE